MSSRFLRFRDLKERGIIDSWAQLDNLIKKYGFPPGRMLSPNVRAWDEEEELEPWLPAARRLARPRAAPQSAKPRPQPTGAESARRRAKSPQADRCSMSDLAMAERERLPNRRRAERGRL